MSSLDDRPPHEQALRLLSRLTRKGSCIRFVESSRAFHLEHPGRRDRRAPPEPVARQVIDFALGQQWLRVDGPVLRLSEAGALALRSGTIRRDGRDQTVHRQCLNHRASKGPIERLARLVDGQGRTVLSAEQIEAARRLAADFEAARMQPRTIMDWSAAALGTRISRSNAPTADDRSNPARERVRRALDDAGSEFADLLLDVCGFEIGLEALERRRGWPARTAKIVLGLALEKLARHYGLIAARPWRSRDIGVWRQPPSATG